MGPKALAAYLKTKNLSVDAFAPMVKSHRSQIYRVLSGKRRPGADLRFRIEDITGGAVPARSWPKPVRRSARRSSVAA